MKKILCFILAISMLFSVIIFAAPAEQAGTKVFADFTKAKSAGDAFSMVESVFSAGPYSSLSLAEMNLSGGAVQFMWPSFAQIVTTEEYAKYNMSMDISVNAGQWCGVGLRGDKEMTLIPNYGDIAIGQGNDNGANIDGSTKGIMLMLHGNGTDVAEQFVVCFRTNDSNVVEYAPIETDVFANGYVNFAVEDSGNLIVVKANNGILAKIQIDTTKKNDKGNYYSVKVLNAIGKVIKQFDNKEVNIPERGVAGIYTRACNSSFQTLSFENLGGDIAQVINYKEQSAFQIFSYDKADVVNNVALKRAPVTKGYGWKAIDAGQIGLMKLNFDRGAHYIKFVSNNENNNMLSADYEVRVDNPDGAVIASGTVPGGLGMEFYAKTNIPEGVHDVYIKFKKVRDKQDRYPVLYSVEFFKEKPYGFYEIPTNTTAPVPRDTYQDTWTSIDDLKRQMPMAGVDSSVPELDKNRVVGMFYYICHDAMRPAIYDMVEMINAAWPNKPDYASLKCDIYGGRSQFGYYVVSDEWIVRKHAQMLVDAGVDVIFFDTTNQVIYENTILTLFKTYEKIRSEGGKTPQIAFMGPDGDIANVHVQCLYNLLYKDGRYKDLWFMWEGKPLILTNFDYVTDPAVKTFFTFRKCWAWQTDTYRWTWLPRDGMYGYTTDKSVVESATVNAAEHPSTNMGKSMSAPGGEPSYSKPYGLDLMENGTSGLGKYYQKQWDLALRNNPKVLFITQWNEYNAGYYTGAENPVAVNQPGTFIDVATPEFSRDLEPIDGYFHDNYYYQTAQNIRHYKGARKTFAASAPAAINVNGDFSQWDNVGPEFRDDINDTAHRDWRGGAADLWYTNKSGRNDIELAKVARDSDNVYFYVATRGPITKPENDPNWMVLYINADGDLNTGWNGYDYVVRPGIGELQEFTDGYESKKVGNVTFKVSGRELMLKIAKKDLFIQGTMSIDFKWADNSITTDDVYDFMDQGDVAPNSRFNYHYTEDNANTEKQVLDGYKFDRNNLSMELASPKTRESVILQLDTKAAAADNKISVLDVAPASINGRTLVPVRFISESFGANVNWDQATKTVTIVAGEFYKTTVIMQIDNPIMTVDGKAVNLDTVPQIVNGRTLIPLRAATEAIGKKVYWNDAYKIIVIAGEGFDFDSAEVAKKLYWGSGEYVKIGGIEKDTELLNYLNKIFSAYK